MALQIDPLPPTPSRADPATFSDKADVFIAAFPTFVSQTNAVAAEVETNRDDSLQAVTDTTTLKNDVITLKNETTTLRNEAEGFRNEAEAFKDTAEASANSAILAPGTSATSTTSMTINVGTKSFSIQTGKYFVPGQFVIISASTAVSNFMLGQITAYNSGTGSITVDVSAISGSGTYTAWTVALSAPAFTSQGKLFIASGSIAANVPVALNTDGTVSSISYVNPETGSEYTFEAANAGAISSCYDTLNNKVVICYRDAGNSSYGTAIVGTVSGSTISFGTPVVFASESTNETTCSFDPNTGKVLIAWKFSSTSLKAVVGTVSGTSISFGSSIVLLNANATNIASCFDSSNNKVNVFYYYTGFVYYNICTISGTSVTATTAASSGLSCYSSDPQITCCYFPSESRSVISYRENVASTYYSKLAAASSNGTALTFGTPVIIDAAVAGVPSISLACSSSNILVSFKEASANYVAFKLGTLSGSVITLGTKVTYSGIVVSNETECVYDVSADRYHIFGNTTGNTLFALSVVPTDASVVMDSVATLRATQTTYISCLYDPLSTRTIVSFQDTGGASFGKSVAVILASKTNAYDFIGFSQNQSTASDGDSLFVKCLGDIDSYRTGLTANNNYYINYLGVLTTSQTYQGAVGRATSSSSLLITRGFR